MDHSLTASALFQSILTKKRAAIPVTGFLVLTVVDVWCLFVLVICIHLLGILKFHKAYQKKKGTHQLIKPNSPPFGVDHELLLCIIGKSGRSGGIVCKTGRVWVGDTCEA